MFLDIKDLLLTPVYLLVIYFFALLYRRNFIKDKGLKKYFIPGLTLKIIGAISLGLIYQFYYQGGDTSSYFSDIKVIYNIFLSDPYNAFRLIFADTKTTNLELIKYTQNIFFFNDAPTYMVVRVGAIFSLFTFGTYTLIAIGFAILSFLGAWIFFASLTKIYPHHIKEIAIAIFFIPSVFFWGSGLMKDSLSLATLSLSFYSFYNIFIAKKRNLLFNALLFFFALYVLKSIKIYIALCLIPAIMLYLFILFNHKIKSRSLRNVIKPILVLIGLYIGYLAGAALVEDDARYNLDAIANTAKMTSEWIAYVSQKEGGSYYSLGEYDPTIIGMLKNLPEAIWVTLFRPYLWESKNIIMVFSAIESLFFLCITAWTIFKLRPSGLIYVIKKNPYVQFALVFSLTFAFAVGISSYNFGTLARYKIPMMPFYLSAFFIMKSYYVKKSKKIM